jgi:hypothetical protein
MRAMTTREARTLPLVAALAAALALAGCGQGGNEEANLAALDNQLANQDPALTSALEDQIAVDPQLAQQSNRNAVRPPATPSQAQYPAGEPPAQEPAQAGKGGRPTTAGVSSSRPSALSTAPGGPGCTAEGRFDYNPAWAQRMPPEFPVYPGATVTEAAANNQGDCRTRVVTFRTGHGFQRVLDWYRAQAARAGYSAEREARGGDHILAGTNEGSGGAYFLIVTPRGNGAEGALIVNNGR